MAPPIRFCCLILLMLLCSKLVHLLDIDELLTFCLFLCLMGGLVLVFLGASTKPGRAAPLAFAFFKRKVFPGADAVEMLGSASIPSVQQKQPVGAFHLGLLLVTLSSAGLIHLLVPANRGSAGFVPADCKLFSFLLFLCLMAGLVLVFWTAAAKMPRQLVPLSTHEGAGAAGEDAEMLGSPEGRVAPPTAHKPMGTMDIGLAVTSLSCAGLLHLLIPQDDGNVGLIPSDLYPPLFLFLCLMAGMMLLFLGASANGRRGGTVSFHIRRRGPGEEAALLGLPAGCGAAAPPQGSMGAIRVGLMLVALSCSGLVHLLVSSAKHP